MSTAKWPRKGVHSTDDGHQLASEALIRAIAGRELALPTDLVGETGGAGGDDDVSLTSGPW